ncbi:MAG: HAMP domain-containing sensor histidine kinase [Eubacteriales bacterium]|jgi:signal transduction histidine kinase|nr:HAMP domain-containing sensor histidine kinase [Eubacteriales bacterium]
MTKLPQIKARPRAAQIFAVIIAGIIATSTVLTYGIIFVLLKLKIGTITAVVTSTTYMGIFTTILGIGIAAYTSAKMLSPILKINDAAKKVARGDFSVRLEEKSIAKEIEEIAKSFNIMVKELSNTETLRTDFVSNVSHEFKTPLSAIEGYATLLQDERLSKDEQALYVSRILENTSRLSKLTHSILSLSQLENQEIVLQQETFMLDEQIRRVLLGYEPLWEEKKLNIDLALKVTPYYGSKSLLAQVWSNLIDNAIKFSRPGGTLSISCGMIEGKVVARIRDTGIGMSEEVRQRAFDKFYQGERSHSVQGSGLGLALVRRIVSLCGGTIELMSKEGKGTEITVSLSVAQPPS